SNHPPTYLVQDRALARGVLIWSMMRRREVAWPAVVSSVPISLPTLQDCTSRKELSGHRSGVSDRAAARAPRAATRPLHRRAAWLGIFVVRCGLPCEPPVGGHSCSGGMMPHFHRAVCTDADGQVE